MNLWLDDLRPPPRNWCWARTAREAIGQLAQGDVAELSMDDDLGWPVDENGTGYQVACWLEEQAVKENWSVVPASIRVHSDNPVGAGKIGVAIDSIRRMREERTARMTAGGAMEAYQVRYTGNLTTLIKWVERSGGYLYCPYGQEQPELVVVLPRTCLLAGLRAISDTDDVEIASIAPLGPP